MQWLWRLIGPIFGKRWCPDCQTELLKQGDYNPNVWYCMRCECEWEYES